MTPRPRWQSFGSTVAFLLGLGVTNAWSQTDQPTAPATKEKEKADAPAGSPPRGLLGDTKRFNKLGGWGGFGGVMGQFGLSKTTMVMMPAVQKDLKLTPAQIESIRKWTEEMRTRGEKAFRRPQQQPAPVDEEGNPQANGPNGFNPLAMMETIRDTVRDGEEGLNRILNKKQRDRLEQIVLQMEGLGSLGRPEVAAAMNLSPEQTESIAEILGQVRTEQAAFMMRQAMNARASFSLPPPGAPGSPPAKTDRAETKRSPDARRTAMAKAMEGADQIQNNAMAQINRLLTRRQRERFEKMLGEPFDPAQLNGPGGFAGMGRQPGEPPQEPAKPATTTAGPASTPEKPAPSRSSKLRDARLGKSAATPEPKP